MSEYEFAINLKSIEKQIYLYEKKYNKKHFLSKVEKSHLSNIVQYLHDMYKSCKNEEWFMESLENGIAIYTINIKEIIEKIQNMI